MRLTFLTFLVLCECYVAAFINSNGIAELSKRTLRPSFSRQHELMYMSSKDKDNSPIPVLDEFEDDEKPADVVGAQFFGGNTIKEDLYDPVAEAEAASKLEEVEQPFYSKFEDPSTFPDNAARKVAMKIQSELNNILAGNIVSESIYSSNSLKWDSPFATNDSRDPMKGLEQANEFYNSMEIGIMSAKSIPSANDQNSAIMEIRWVVSVLWPNAWESRATLSGTSKIIVDTNSNEIISQNDLLDDTNKDGKDIVGLLYPQLTPRFWDLYHIGMSPSAEVTQRLPSSKGKGLLSSYELFEIAPQLVYQPTYLDKGGRDLRLAQVMPNHCFTTSIRTMGPKKDKFVTTSPVEITIQKSSEKGANMITWTIPVAARLSKSEALPLPTLEENEIGLANSAYKYQPRRRLATLPFGGNPQDVEVSNVRRKLYEAVVNDGLKPKMGNDGKPFFFFLQNDAKACFTEDGLGMAVYEWQPKFVNGNEIGIELEL